LSTVTNVLISMFFFFFSSRRRHTRLQGDWSSDVCSSDLRAGVLFDGQRRQADIDLLNDAGQLTVATQPAPTVGAAVEGMLEEGRSEERRVGKEWRARVVWEQEKNTEARE